MLVVAVQVPVSVTTDPEPEASAGSVSASNAQITDATDLMLTASPPFVVASILTTRIARNLRGCGYKTLKPQKPAPCC
jgi:hypothetical protein